jgi:hypothetical protein
MPTYGGLEMGTTKMPTSVQSHASDERGSLRASLYLAAVLYFDGSSSLVKIRNISSTGALVEGKLIPTSGSLVQLVRGELIVHGFVAWSDDARCGLKFSRSVDVQRWRAAPSNGDQQRVDKIVKLVKAGAVPLPVRPLVHANRDPAAEPSADLQRALKLLEALGAVLARDSDMVTRHGTALQGLDIAMQVIAAVEATLAGNTDFEIDATKMLGLRRSADQALQKGT